MNKIKNMKHNRKIALALVAGLAITGIVSASAASLGGIGTESLGADAAVVASCDTVGGVDVDYDVSASRVLIAEPVVSVDAVVVSSVDPPCDGLAYEVELFNDLGASLGVVNGTVLLVAGEFTTANFTTPPDAEAVTGIAITISG